MHRAILNFRGRTACVRNVSLRRSIFITATLYISSVPPPRYSVTANRQIHSYFRLAKFPRGRKTFPISFVTRYWAYRNRGNEVSKSGREWPHFLLLRADKSPRVSSSIIIIHWSWGIIVLCVSECDSSPAFLYPRLIFAKKLYWI